MEVIAPILVLTAIFAMKAVSILRWQDDEIAKSASFSWTKPNVKVEGVAAVEEHAETEARVAWSPSYAAARVRSNWAMPVAH